METERVGNCCSTFGTRSFRNIFDKSSLHLCYPTDNNVESELHQSIQVKDQKTYTNAINTQNNSILQVKKDDANSQTSFSVTTNEQYQPKSDILSIRQKEPADVDQMVVEQLIIEIQNLIESEKLKIVKNYCYKLLKNEQSDIQLENKVDELIWMAGSLLIIQVNEYINSIIKKFDQLINNLPIVQVSQVKIYINDLKEIQNIINTRPKQLKPKIQNIKSKSVPLNTVRHKQLLLLEDIYLQLCDDKKDGRQALDKINLQFQGGHVLQVIFLNVVDTIDIMFPTEVVEEETEETVQDQIKEILSQKVNTQSEQVSTQEEGQTVPSKSGKQPIVKFSNSSLNTEVSGLNQYKFQAYSSTEDKLDKITSEMNESENKINHINRFSGVPSSWYKVLNVYNQNTERKNQLFKCTINGCNKVFNKSFNLWNHFRKHTKERPFQCYICKNGFSQRGNLKRHLSTLHFEEYNVMSEMQQELKLQPVSYSCMNKEERSLLGNKRRQSVAQTETDQTKYPKL